MRSANDIARTDTDKRSPIRTCVGCRERATQASLLRVGVIDGRIEPDPSRRLAGRGAYVHPDLTCVDRATRRGGLARALRTRLDPVSSAAWRNRMASLLPEMLAKAGTPGAPEHPLDPPNLFMPISTHQQSTDHNTGLTRSEPRFVVATPEAKGE